jgi:hypothetical protein
MDAQADLVLAHVSDELTVLAQPLSGLPDSSSSVVVLPEPGLSVILQAMRLPHVTVCLSQDYVDPRLLTYVSSKLVRGDVFGLSKVMPWGVHIHSQLVNTHEERTQALATTVQFAKGMGVRGKYREAIELVVDELLMNALYNAPVGPDGPLFSNVAPKDRSDLRLERPAILQMACDGSRFAVGVRDSFGSLKKDTILAYIERCLVSTDQIQRKTSGAGLGLYLVANNVTEFIANLLPGTATEIICVFDVRAPGQQLKHFGIYQESFARHAEIQEGKKRQLVGTSMASAQAERMGKIVPLTLATAIVLLLVAGFLLVWPFVSGPGKGSLAVTVEPSGSTIYVNGVRRGVAEPTLKIADLDINAPLEVTAKLPGYRDAQEVTSVTRGGTQEIKLTLRQMKARVRVTSSPSGAAVWLDGKQTKHLTPALLERLEPGRKYAVRLSKHGYMHSNGVFTPSAEETLLYHVNLPLAQAFAKLSLQSRPNGARLYINNIDTGLTTPVKGHVLRSGQKYVIKVAMEKYVPYEEIIEPRKGDHIKRQIALNVGGILSMKANVRARVLFNNQPKGNLPITNMIVPEGTYKVRVRGEVPYLDYTFKLEVKAGAKINRNMLFGFVAANKRKGLKIRVDATTKVTRIALPPGRHRVTLIDPKTGQTRTETVLVIAKRAIVLD